jgi:hypothetical protein
MSSFTDKAQTIRTACLQEKEKDPILIAKKLMHLPCVSMHGPEHHFLDGAVFLTAYHNLEGGFDLAAALDELLERSSLMPGATCGYWGVCGSASSVGSALSILHHSGPLSADDFYKDNLRLTSRCLSKVAECGGPRCCKRNAFLSITTASAFVQEKYGVQMKIAPFVCDFSQINPTCLQERCPFNPKAKKDGI